MRYVNISNRFYSFLVCIHTFWAARWSKDQQKTNQLCCPKGWKELKTGIWRKNRNPNLGFFDLTFSKWFIHSLQFEKTSFLPPPPSIVPYSSPPLRFVVPFAADHLVEALKIYSCKKGTPISLQENWSWSNLSTENWSGIWNSSEWKVVLSGVFFPAWIRVRFAGKLSFPLSELWDNCCTGIIVMIVNKTFGMVKHDRQ